MISPNGTIIGWEMGAALALGQALGINPAAVGLLLPPIEEVMVRKMNETNEE